MDIEKPQTDFNRLRLLLVISDKRLVVSILITSHSSLTTHYIFLP